MDSATPVRAPVSHRETPRAPSTTTCRFCRTPLSHTVVDLGKSPLCESFLAASQLEQAEVFYPLHVMVCHECFLVQLPAHASGEEIFSDYAYFSSYSESWLAHAKRYVEQMTARWDLGPHSLVVEIASNDGYLLQYFVERGIPCLGIEPAANVAQVAVQKGVPTVVDFFGRRSAEARVAEGRRADLLLGNNVLAHVPDLHDFVDGFKTLLAPAGVITFEFPHLMRLIDDNQFDTIYHEHFSYFSLGTAQAVLEAHDLTVFDVEELPTHGGSLRIYACHREDTSKTPTSRLAELHQREEAVGILTLDYYRSFAERVQETKRQILTFLIEAKRAGKTIAGYGAPGKGNTLLNYCGIRTDFLDYTVDRSPHKQGMYLPGTHIPIFHPDRLAETRPDIILILPWNLQEEIASQLQYVREWGGQLVVPIPTPRVLE